jgi:hypothetical protein
MRFFVTDHIADVLHVSKDCRIMKRSNHRDADMNTITASRGLCIVCAPTMTGVLNPIRRERTWG